MRSLLKYCTLGALLIHLAMGASDADKWDYTPGRYGPENWGTLVKEYCGGSAQSPIDLVYRNTVKQTYPAFTFTGYNNIPADAKFSMTNNGHAISVYLDSNSSAYRVGGGGLPGNNYRLAQFHFHWSFLDNLYHGSEHVVNGGIFPSELHLVHWNADQHTDLGDAALSNVSTHSSLAVLGFFLELDGRDNPAFEPMLKYINQVSLSNTSVDMTSEDRFKLDDLLGTASRSDFFRYNGSLTTPTCNEVVTWTVFKETIGISRKQLYQFINSTYYYAPPNTTPQNKMEGNYRPPQPLNGRTVYRSFDDSSLNVTPPPSPPPKTTKSPANGAMRYFVEVQFVAVAAMIAAILN